MKQKIFFILLLGILSASAAKSEKKPLDHSVYDAWESIMQIFISNDGRYAVYCVAPQEGDSTLYVNGIKTPLAVRIDRGYGPRITDDSRYAVFKIKPSQEEKKDARKKRKKADEQPKDSLGWLRLGSQNVEKIPDVKSFKTPEKGSGYFAYTTQMPKDTTNKRDEKNDFMIVYFFDSGTSDTIPFVSDYVISRNGKYISYLTKPSGKDSTAVPGVYLYDTKTLESTALMEAKGDYKLQSFDEEASQFAFFATTDTTKRNPKVYNLYYTKTDSPTAKIIADTLSDRMPAKWAVSTFRDISFSRDGSKLYFSISPVPEPRDTTVDESEKARLDVWHYMDDYLQPVQLKQLRTELNRSYLCVFDVSDLSRFVRLGSTDLENISTSNRGNGEFALGTTSKGYRIESQWTGSSKNDVYTVSTVTGERTLVVKALESRPMISSTGKYVTWFDRETAQWYLYSVADKTVRCLTDGIDVSFADARSQTPDKPGAFGTMGWSKDDGYFYIYDMYDIWQIDPAGKTEPSMITKGVGRKEKTTFRHVRLDIEAEHVETDKPMLLSAFNNDTKESGFYTLNVKSKAAPQKRIVAGKTFASVQKAKNADTYIYTQSDFNNPPDLWATANLWKNETQLSQINPQMKDYLWGTAELVGWKSKDGVDLKGLLYKPENFDPEKKYPMMVYFYERHSDDLYKYYAPAPSRSTVNVSFFCSRGYLVFLPDINYVDGHPGQSSYNSVVAGVEHLSLNPWVDKEHIGVQGQSWGGYQVAYLVTQTNIFAAAGAGAPVANMTSAYGGIRWATGLNRQMQYERQQSRIGKTLWDGFDLYIENSPIFFADKVNTPLLIMHNDNDGAVPWYQGIEYFTALRRLGKVVYMLQYNGEEHNLIHRRNTRDLSVRLQQFFDHYLKGEPMPVWMTKGVPATEKGRTYGLEIEE
ncbi:MAG: prolyl oligopeptidase family serine peptidase [Tannerella sp.]|jgi:dipeptidyl aminopeptidase/acylaminoacyl peptidase|nr:prolyl oligopeptidase family serine peptidase [Tannerella sp.]